MRKTGVLLPVASLPSNYGIGDFGSFAYEFIDISVEMGMKIWQILPLNPLGYGNSPYQPYSSFAGDELYISLEKLQEKGLLKEIPAPFHKEATSIDYSEVRAYKEPSLKEAFHNFVKDKEYEQFASMEWVKQYAVFITLKKANGLKCWNEWKAEHQTWIIDQKLDLTPFEEAIAYEKFVQYMFYCQWKELKDYANEKGIEIMGDVPFYVGIDSLDVWANQKCFLLDKSRPIYIAGVPPDYFSEVGQRWGNPIYNWEYLEETNFKFWLSRIGYNKNLYDIIRIDHFRAFDTYWKIPASCETAIEGEWIEAPGYALFDALYKEMPDIEIVAEDLGDMRPEVYELRDHYHLKGMKIFQFTMDVAEENNDFEDRENMIIYTGTHDNQTMMGWFEAQEEEYQEEIIENLEKLGYDQEKIIDRFDSYVLDSIADWAILPVQDILGLSDEARLNTPGTTGSPNWEWKLENFSELRKRMIPIHQMIIESKREENENE